MDDVDPQYKTADGSAVRVWRDVAKNNYQSEQQGRAVFDEVIYVEVISPGSRGSTPVFEVERFFAKESGFPPRRTHHYEQYEPMIEAFKKGDEEAGMSGTPLKEWPEISRSMAATLKAAKIFTVEGLANIADGQLSAIGPEGRTLREKALAFLAVSKDSAVVTKLVGELEAAKADLAMKDEQIKELAAKIDDIQRQQSGQFDPEKSKSKSKDDKLDNII